MTATIAGISYALPPSILTNEQLERFYPDWDFGRLKDRTGVHERHIATEAETALDLAEIACRNLLAEKRLEASAIDAVIFSTQTPDYLIPSNACLLHGRMELRRHAPAFDTTGGCAGFIYGLKQAFDMIASSAARNILLVTADTYSRLIHEEDRATRCLFGDGGAATLISAAEDSAGIIDIVLGADGRYYNRFIVPAGGARKPRSEATRMPSRDRSGNIRTPEHIQMDGMGVLSFFNSVIPIEVRDIIKRNNLSIDDIDFFIFHQASNAALDSLQKILGIPDRKMIRQMETTGNLVSASIPVALKRAIEKGEIVGDKTLLLCGFGVGLTWGTAIVNFSAQHT